MKAGFSGLALLFHALVIVLFAFVVEYDIPGTPAVVVNGTVVTAAVSAADDFRNYNMFQDVHVMIAIGFGFLMAFLYRNAFTTIGHSFMIMTFVAFWGMLNVGFWHRAVTGEHWDEKVSIGLQQLIESDFMAGSILISFGALVGRCSAEQLLVMAFFEVIFFSINEALAITQYKVADIGGSMVVHLFGAYFGVACSFALESGNKNRKAVYEKFKQFNGSSKTSDTFAMIGALFLWCFWPSFNGALAGDMAQIVLVNTYLAISASCLVSFYAVSFFGNKRGFRMVEIQNATLAGGVAIGSTANMMVQPWAAILIGTVAGFLSVVGYQKIADKMPFLDTCGVHNLHGMPAIMAAIASIIATAVATKEDYTFPDHGITPDAVFARTSDEEFDGGRLAMYQAACLGTTFGIAIGGGIVTGLILRIPALSMNRYFTDTAEWDLEGSDDEKVDEAAEKGEEYVPLQKTAAPSVPPKEANTDSVSGQTEEVNPLAEQPSERAQSAAKTAW